MAVIVIVSRHNVEGTIDSVERFRGKLAWGAAALLEMASFPHLLHVWRR